MGYALASGLHNRRDWDQVQIILTLRLGSLWALEYRRTSSVQSDDVFNKDDHYGELEMTGYRYPINLSAANQRNVFLVGQTAGRVVRYMAWIPTRRVDKIMQ